MVKDDIVWLKCRLRCLVSAINKPKITLSLVLDGREFHGLEAEERNELQSLVVWQKSVIKFKGWYEWWSWVGSIL